MNRLTNLKKVFGLIALLICGVWTAQAGRPQGLGIVATATQETGSICIGTALSPLTEFHLVNPPGITGDPVEIKWTAFGGIEIDGIDTDKSVSIKSLQGTEYLPDNFSKYAKGRLVLECRYDEKAVLDWVFLTGSCPDGTTGTITINVAEGLPPYVTYFDASMDIYKEFTIPDGEVNNKIIGPTCVATDDEVTYSIAPWLTLFEPDKVGYDDYEWFPDGIPSFVQNGVLYLSADKSSITFKVGELEGNDIISVQVGRCNKPNNVLTLPLRPSIPAPVIEPSSCVQGGVRNVKFNIQGADSNVEYKWMSDNWKLVDEDNIGDEKTYQTDINGAANILVEANYINGTGCKSVFSTTKILRSFSDRSKIVAASGENCLEAGVPVKFYMQDAPTPATFSWNYNELTDWSWTPDGELTNDGGEITLTPGANAVSGEILTVTLNDCSNSYREFEFNIKPGNANSITSSSNSFCVTKGQSYTFYTSATTPAADSYKWDLGSGWEPSTGTGLSITATPFGNIDFIRVTPIGIDGCNGKLFEQAVAYQPIAPTGIDIGITGSCINAGIADKITLTTIVPAGTPTQKYSWSIGNLGSINGNPESSSVTVITSGIDGTYPISVVATSDKNVCSTSVSAPANSSVEIDGFDFVVTVELVKKAIFYYEISDQNNWDLETNGLSILWELDTEDVTDYTFPSTTDFLSYGDLLESTSTHNFTVTISLDGCTTKRTLGGANGYHNSSSLFAGLRAKSIKDVSFATTSIDEQQAISNDVTIAPNPAKNEVTVYLSEAGSAEIKIVNMQGSIVERLTTMAKDTVINVSELPAGTYIVSVKQKGKSISKQLIILK